MPPRPVCKGRQDETCEAAWHGTQSAYRHGCRCQHAREAHRLYQKRHREGRNVAVLIDPIGTRRRMQALAAIGWTFTQQVRQIGWSAAPGPLVWGSSAITRGSADQIAELYERLKHTPGPSDLTRRRAATKGWPTPAEWDLGGDIDDVNADARPTESSTVDSVAIELALRGKRVQLTRMERHYAVHAGVAQGMTRQAIANALHMSNQQTRTLMDRPLPDGYELAA